MDEHANADENVIRFGGGDGAIGHAVGNGHAYRALGGAKHLHGLRRILDCHLVEHDGGGLAHQVRCNDGQQSGEAVLVVDQSIGEC